MTKRKKTWRRKTSSLLRHWWAVGVHLRSIWTGGSQDKTRTYEKEYAIRPMGMTTGRGARGTEGEDERRPRLVVVLCGILHLLEGRKPHQGIIQKSEDSIWSKHQDNQFEHMLEAVSGTGT